MLHAVGYNLIAEKIQTVASVIVMLSSSIQTLLDHEVLASAATDKPPMALPPQFSGRSGWRELPSADCPDGDITKYIESTSRGMK
jgi:2-keto-3-deoxy-galactonokinase